MASEIRIGPKGTKTLWVTYDHNDFNEAIAEAKREYGLEHEAITIIAMPASMGIDKRRKR